MQHLHPKAKIIFYINALSFVFLMSIWVGGVLIAITENWLVGIFTLLFMLVVPHVYAQLLYQSWRYELTPKALKIEKGIIWKKYISIPYGRIQNVDIYRGLLARIVGLSDLQIQTAGYSMPYTYMTSEGRLPGLDPKLAEEMRDKLVDLIQRDEAQGL